MTPAECAELNELLGALRENTISAEQHARLNQILSEHADARRQYVQYMGLVATLHKCDVAALAPTVVRPQRWRWVAAAVSVAALVIAAVLVRQAAPTGNEKGAANFVAALTAGSEMRWNEAAANYAVGQKIPVGRCKLNGGIALITFQSGATAMLQGPAELELLTEDKAFLHSGQVFVRAPQDGNGFKLETPTARLLDLGTEFGVSVNASGDALLQVYEGEVLAKLKNKDVKHEQRFKGGEAVGMTSNFQTQSFWPERFVRTLPDVTDPKGRGYNAYNTSRYDAIDILPGTRVKIDGDLSDWNLSARIRAVCEPPYGENHYLEAAMMYDSENLYISGHVGDPFAMRSQVSPHIIRELYGAGGGVALRVSTDRKQGWPLSGESRYKKGKRPFEPIDLNDKLSFLMLWFYEPEKLACLQIKNGMDLHNPRVNPDGYEGAWKKDADGKGYTIEYRISWKLLNAENEPPQAGDTLGTMWIVHWSDELGSTWKGQLFEVVKPNEPGWNFDRAATWGRAQYRDSTFKPTPTGK